MLKLRLARRFAIGAALLSLFTVVLGVGGAQAAIPDSDISQSTVHSTAYRVGNGSSLRFYGVIQAKNPPGTTNNICYMMQYLQPEGNWVPNEFYASENVQVEPMTHCSWEIAPYHTWSLHNGLDVRGIRFVRYDGGGTNVGTHCNTATTCRDMYQGT